ncbi:hypothetical protein NSB25_25790 [Acetatifactor muris]|uniref:Uncharacterized protein n=1 Tax=Acetatifactor muris TaxID=879566 RepID=A0A2K4ZNZ8_9FIRM|nr:hypothetical protein [Acetatifactor muris]MCR2050649.1 hypothetical protein [Acetatifactor muris]SOY32199.1 hypothetical protein AMURIS_04957 [Acetatifactor muris]
MDDNITKGLQDSLSEWSKIDKLIADRENKDKRIISTFCAANDPADMKQILDLLEKHNGMPKHDKDVVYEFKDKYPSNLNTKLISNFLDVKDIYSQYLESGGKNND